VAVEEERKREQQTFSLTTEIQRLRLIMPPFVDEYLKEIINNGITKKRVDTAGFSKILSELEEPESQASDNGVRTEQAAMATDRNTAIIEKREPAKSGRKTDRKKSSKYLFISRKKKS
jgi:hypothetical protein